MRLSQMLIFFSCITSQFFNLPLQAKSNRADYIVIGVGTAGALVAKRLTDDKQTSVIAIHNGKNLNNDPLIKYTQFVPVTVLSALLGSPLNPIDFALLPPIARTFALFAPQPAAPLYITGATVPQTNANNRELLWVMGLPEGGASSINAGAWCRATDQLLSQWEAIAGPNWSVNRLTDIYKSLENYHGRTPDPEARGYHGPLVIRQPLFPSAVSQKFTQAIVEALGVPDVLDYNDPNTPIGASSLVQYTQLCPDGKLRESSAIRFLNKNVVTPNGHGVNGRKLEIIFESTALRTIWDGNTAIGVEYSHNGKTKKVYANRGVIVCAGLYSSPFLLHSGVGSAATLTPLGIPVVYDNPNVGQGLSDQPHVVLFFTSDPVDYFKTPPNSIFAGISWLASPLPGSDPISRQVRFSTVNQVPGITAALLDLCQPQSLGSVSINSNDPLAQPVINFGVLSNPQDLLLYQTTFKTYIKAIAAKLESIDPLYQLIFPDLSIINDDAKLTAFIQDEIDSNFHFQRHCRMAPLNQGGVVDSNGRVYGVNNLIVADNSIAPLEMDGSPMSSGYLIAENIVRLLGY